MVPLDLNSQSFIAFISNSFFTDLNLDQDAWPMDSATQMLMDLSVPTLEGNYVYYLRFSASSLSPYLLFLLLGMVHKINHAL